MKDEVLMEFIQSSERAFGKILEGQENMKEHLASVSKGQSQLRTDFNTHTQDTEAHGGKVADKQRSLWIAVLALASSAAAWIWHK
mgnify:CR=1 FL=1